MQSVFQGIVIDRLYVRILVTCTDRLYFRILVTCHCCRDGSKPVTVIGPVSSEWYTVPKIIITVDRFYIGILVIWSLLQKGFFV